MRTLQDYDMREFLDEEDRVFSSFAELVGLTRSLDLALAARQNMTLNDLLQGSINTFVGMVQEDLSKAA